MTRLQVGPSGRRFDAADGALTLSAFVLGATGAVESLPLLLDFTDRFYWLYELGDPLGSLLIVIRGGLPALSGLAAALTFAVLIMRLRRPRPPISRCFRQPGTAACASASIVLLLEIVSEFVNLTIRLDLNRLRLDFRMWDTSPSLSFHARTVLGAIALSLDESPGLAVAGAYLALWAGGLGRPEPTWLDRAGRALGWLWILVALGFICLPRKP